MFTVPRAPFGYLFFTHSQMFMLFDIFFKDLSEGTCAMPSKANGRSSAFGSTDPILLDAQGCLPCFISKIGYYFAPSAESSTEFRCQLTEDCEKEHIPLR